MTGSAKPLECKYPSRMGLLQRPGVYHQGKFSIVSFTASVQILFDLIGFVPVLPNTRIGL